MVMYSVSDAINSVRASKLNLFSESMDSYVNSVLELFNFVGYDDDGRCSIHLLKSSQTRILFNDE